MQIWFNLLAETSSSGEPNGGWQNLLIWLIPIALIILFMVFSSRQRKKQQQEAENKLNSIQVGTKIQTIGLIYGTVVAIDNEYETFTVKTGNDEYFSYITIDKKAIYQVIPELTPAQEQGEAAEGAATEQVFEAEPQKEQAEAAAEQTDTKEND